MPSTLLNQFCVAAIFEFQAVLGPKVPGLNVLLMHLHLYVCLFLPSYGAAMTNGSVCQFVFCSL